MRAYSMNFLYKICVVLILLVSSQGYADQRPVIKAVTVGDSFPYNFAINGEIQGLGYDVTHLLADRAGYQLVIETMPWTRALKIAETEPNVIIFSLARTGERENLFYWLGPITTSQIWLYKLSIRRDITITKLDDVQRYIVGDTMNNAIVPKLKSLGIKFDPAPSDVSNCRKFKIGRIDLVPVDPQGIVGFLSACGLSIDQVEKTISLTLNSDLYIGLGKSSSPELVNRLNIEFELIRKNHELERINSKWKSISD